VRRASQDRIVLQGRSLTIRSYVESRHGWLFRQGHPPIAANSLQSVEMLVRNERFIGLTPELDTAPEILDPPLKFVAVRDKSAEVQTIAVAANARLPLPRICRIFYDIIAD
jgi:DNA-binding transcriptional LysR family regulator